MRVGYGALFAVSIFAISGCKKSSETSNESNILVWESTAKWTSDLEIEFQKFVQRIGDARWAHNLRDRPTDLAAWKSLLGYDPGQCVFLKDCIKNSAINPLYSDDDKALTIEADCGDVPGMLRAYFSFKKKLPFIYTWAVQVPRDNRGIFPPTIIKNQSSLKTMNQLFTDIRNHQHSHFYRTPINVEHTDTYPVRIGRDTIKPGTVVYFTGGHAMVVFRIKSDGTILVIQGHPGEPNGIPPSYFSVTSINETTLPQDFSYKSGGFRNWRPYVNSNQTSFVHTGIGSNGTDGPKVVYKDGGGIVYASNKDIPGLDREETNFQRSYNVPSKGTVNFHDFLKSQLCDPAVCGKRRPSELRDMLFGICTTLKERQERVASAVKGGLTKAQHPGIPVNVYSASNPWEAQSTPGFDVRLRSMYSLAIRYMRETRDDLTAGANDIDFSGTPADLLKIYQGYLDEVASSAECQVQVQGETENLSLSFTDVNEKLYDMSFDPYHCPELRWGIKAKCGDEQTKFYDEEARLRNVSSPGERPDPAGIGANGLPAQLTRGPAQPPSLVDRNLQEALNAMKNATANPTPQPTAAPTAVPTTAPTAVPTTAPTATPEPAFPMFCKVIAVDDTLGIMQIWATPSAPNIYDYHSFAVVNDTLKVLGENGIFYHVNYNGYTGFAKKAMLGNCRK